jgi:hypothetical protein
MINQTCTQAYTRNQNTAGWQLNAIPVRTVTIDGDTYYTIYFPRPWILTGLVTLNETAAAPPSYTNSYVNPMSPSAHSAYALMFMNVFLDLAFATTHEFSSGYAINYVEPGIQSKDYRGKFSRWLNGFALNTPEQMYNSIIQPESLVSFFCQSNTATAIDVWQERHRALIDFIKSTIDQELMGAPGVYTFASSGSASPMIESQTDYETFIPE